MDPQVEARFQRMEAILHAMAERGNQMEARWEKQHQRDTRKHEQAMARIAKAEARMDRAEARADDFDRKLDAIRKMIAHGMRILVKFESGMADLRVEMDELAKMHKAFLRNQGNGHGNGKNGGNGKRI